jgi:hypothetical protein
MIILVVVAIAAAAVSNSVVEANLYSFGVAPQPPPPPPKPPAVPHFYIPPSGGPNDKLCDPKKFIKSLTPAARTEFYALEMNATLTKAQITDAVKQLLQSTPALSEYTQWQTNLAECESAFKANVSARLTTTEGRMLFDTIMAAVDDQSITRRDTCARVRDALNAAPDSARQDLSAAAHPPPPPPKPTTLFPPTMRPPTSPRPSPRPTTAGISVAPGETYRLLRMKLPPPKHFFECERLFGGGDGAGGIAAIARDPGAGGLPPLDGPMPALLASEGGDDDAENEDGDD